jgi:hypothetical protein
MQTISKVEKANLISYIEKNHEMELGIIRIKRNLNLAIETMQLATAKIHHKTQSL